MRSGLKFTGIVISYMGNIDGRNEELSNHPKYVEKALKAGYHVCVEVVFHNGGFLLPHAPINGFNYSPMPPAFFSRQRVWALTTDTESLDALCNIGAHCFAIAERPTLTSAQFIWTPPPHRLVDRSIAFFPEEADPAWLDQAEPAGLCSNEPIRYV
jgi:hypothetical protein